MRGADIFFAFPSLLLLIGSVILFKESFTAVQWLGVAGFSAGMVLFFHQRLNSLVHTSDEYLTGVGLIVGAAVVWSVLAPRTHCNVAALFANWPCWTSTRNWPPVMRSISNMEAQALPIK